MSQTNGILCGRPDVSNKSCQQGNIAERLRADVHMPLQGAKRIHIPSRSSHSRDKPRMSTIANKLRDLLYTSPSTPQLPFIPRKTIP